MFLPKVTSLSFLIILLSLTGTTARALPIPPTQPFTQLRERGNDEVRARFNEFLKRDEHCAPVHDGKRVILTGFGLWAGLKLSYSGFVIENLRTFEFWPATSLTAHPGPKYTRRREVLDEHEVARITNRSFQLPDGSTISACLVTVDVLWDLGGAVVAEEMSRFQPNAVIMTGIAGSRARLESGAVNFASTDPGFSPNGEENEENIPIRPEILPNELTNFSAPMTWDNQKLALLVRPAFARLGVPLLAAKHPSPGNTYICNNISYIALAAAAGRQLDLAGGKIHLEPRVTSHPRIGFFHYPFVTNETVGRLAEYAQILMKLTEGTLAGDRSPVEPLRDAE